MVSAPEIRITTEAGKKRLLYQISRFYVTINGHGNVGNKRSPLEQSMLENNLNYVDQKSFKKTLSKLW